MTRRRSRAVDDAMAEDRLPKSAMRALWIDEVRSVAYDFPRSEEPWYLTLPGSEGRDIDLLVEENLLALTETQAIAESHVRRVVAVESNNSAHRRLVEKFPGLWVKQVDFRSLIRAEGVFHWPQGQDITVCRARVVNLDLNTPLTDTQRSGDVVFPVLAWITKLSEIHNRAPRVDWTLCLTLHGAVNLSTSATTFTSKFFAENSREAEFAEGARRTLGQLTELISTPRKFSPDGLTSVEQQRFLMILVPKLVSHLHYGKGWRVETARNLCYGGEDVAPMVSWIIRFRWNQEALGRPGEAYRNSLSSIFGNMGRIGEDGKLLPLEEL